MGKRTEKHVQAEVFAAIGGRPDCCIFRNHVGLAKHGDRTVRTGLHPGSADLIGVGPGGRFLSIEVKGPGGRASDKQKQWARIMRQKGAIAGIVWSAEEAVRLVENPEEYHENNPI